MAILKTPTGVVHRLNGDTVTIGRGASNAIPLADSACSSRHAQFVEDETGWRIEDRGSLNGTFVNDQRVQSARLGHGDRVQVGATELVFELDGASTPAPAAAALSGGSGYSSSFLQSIVGDRDPDSESPPGGIWGQSLLIDDDDADEVSGSNVEIKPIDPAAPTSAQTMILSASARAKGRLESPLLRRRPNESLLEAKLRLIQGVSEKLVRIFDPKQMLDEILAIVIEQTGADRGLLCLLDDHRKPVPLAARGLGEGQQVRVSRTVLQTLLDRRSGVLIQQSAGTANILRSLEEMNVCSTLCVPLWTGESIIGLLSLDSTRPTKVFTEDDLDLLLAVAHQAAIGIERGRLSQLVESEREARAYLSKYLDNRIVEQISHRGDGEDPLAPTERIVTVLFSDIVSFTKICEGLPPVQVAGFIREYLTTMTEIVFAHGGTIDKYIGDALMALFGAPMPSPDSAVSAVRAALEMRDRIREFRRPKPGGAALRVRVGINTGLVVVGNIGSTRRMEYTAIGDAVNVAARLQAFARPNEICIDETTLSQTGGAFQVEEIGTIDVRNRAEPISIYKVLAAR
jgi:adenylate cyclase